MILLCLIVFLIATTGLGLIMVIIGSTNKKKELLKTGAIGSITSFVFLILVVIYGMFKTVEKAKQGIDKAQVKFQQLAEEGARQQQQSLSERNKMIEILKTYEADTMEVSADFYTDFGFRDWWRLPLTYPYSIETIDVLDEGQLQCVYPFSEGYLKKGQLGNITHIAFDKNFLLTKNLNGNSGDNQRDTVYYMFNFNNQELTNSKSLDDLYKRAYGLGFEGDSVLMSLREYYDIF